MHFKSPYQPYQSDKNKKRSFTCSLAGEVIPILRRKDRNISSSMAVSFSSVRGTMGTETVLSVTEVHELSLCIQPEIKFLKNIPEL